MNAMPCLSRWWMRRAGLFGLGLLVLLLASCGTDVSEIASSVRDAASQGLEKAKETAGDVSRGVTDAVETATTNLNETAGFAGSCELVVGQPLTTSACYATCIALGPDRPGVLQVQSYQDADQESFPSVFVRANITETDLAALVGQTLEAQLFVKRQQEEPTLYSRDAPVQLKIQAIEEGLLIGQITGGSVANAQTPAPVGVSGSFRGLIR